jgi:small-conductance mechanosensitive channel
VNDATEPLRLFGIKLIGATPANLHKLLLTLALIIGAFLIAWLLRRILRAFIGSRSGTRFHFWARQAVSLSLGVLVVLGITSIWFDDPTRLATALGLVTAGLAFALQRVITAVAGYFVILRGKTFNVGDRIVMGGVRGDVLALSFMQTKIMEMGQPPQVQSADPAVWVKSRQFTGRIVTVTNDSIFSEPVYNYTDQFPYVWDEITVSIHFEDQRDRAEEILLTAARNHAATAEGLGGEEARRLQSRYGIGIGELDPTVYWRIGDSWLNLTVRFLAGDHGVRAVKDRMSREIVRAFEEAGIGFASTAYEISSFPPLRVSDETRTLMSGKRG